MKQAHLAGRTRGLRPKQHRQLDRLSHRRHPESVGADLLTLERLADLATELEQPLHLVLDGRGLCRLLWVGPLSSSESLLQHLPEAPRRQAGGWRLVSCCHQQSLNPNPKDAVVALDLAPRSWLWFSDRPAPDGQRPAALLRPDPAETCGWCELGRGDLRQLCQGEHDPGGSAPLQRQTRSESTERVLLLTLSTRDRIRNERDLSELEGLVRSAGARPVAVIRQRPGQTNAQTLWGTGKLQEAALEVRRNQASLVITDRELTPVQSRTLERLLDCLVMDRSQLILDIFAAGRQAAGRLQVELAQLRYRLPRLSAGVAASPGRAEVSAPGGLGKHSLKKIDAPSLAGSSVCCAISDSSVNTAAVCGNNAGPCPGWPSSATPTPANQAC